MKENTQINRITRHREEYGFNTNCNYLKVVDGNKTNGKVRERYTLVIPLQKGVCKIFGKFSVFSNVKEEIPSDNKHLKQPPSL